MNLLDETLALARTSDRSVAEICKAARVTDRWYYMFLAGEIKDPSVRRVQRVYDFLSAGDSTARPEEERAA